MASSKRKKEFLFEHWLRETGTAVDARVLTVRVRENLPELFPELFPDTDLWITTLAQGWSNFALKISGKEQHFVLRLKPIHGGRNLAQYRKEIWILEQVGSHLPVLPVIPNSIGRTTLPVSKDGETAEYAYVLQPFVPYQTASSIVPDGERTKFMERLGQIAQTVNSIPVTGYGNQLSVESQNLEHQSWKDCAKDMLSVLQYEELSPLKLLPNKELRKAFTVVEKLQEIATAPMLYHLDFAYNWDNILVDQLYQVQTLIDWEFAGAGPAAYLELSSTLYCYFRDGVSDSRRNREFSAFVHGYGLTQVEYREAYELWVNRFVLYYCLSALHKFNLAIANDRIEREPWRKQFAIRAAEVILQLVSGKRSAGKSALVNLEEAA